MKKKAGSLFTLLFVFALILSSCAFGTLISDVGEDEDPLYTPMEMDRIMEPNYVQFRVARRYYDTLTDVERQAYRIIHNEIFDFPERILIPALSEDQLRDVMLALRYDNPLIFFLDNSYSFMLSGGRNYVCPRYTMKAEEAEPAAAALLQAARAIAEPLAGEDAYTRELGIHDALCGSCSYESGAFDTTAYGALVNGRAVCEGYSLAAKLLFDMTGLESCVISGTGFSRGVPERHMWNAVYIDGAWYHLDCTWDDPIREENDTFTLHRYFNLTDGDIAADHTVERKPETVVCRSTAANYFRRSGAYCTAENWETVIAAHVRQKAFSEFCFESPELLAQAQAALFTNGGIWDMIPESPQISYAVEEITRTVTVYIKQGD